MKLNELQEEVHQWSGSNFDQHDPINPLLGIVEEIGELCHAVLKRRQNIRMDEDHDANERDAIGDIVVFLCDYCSMQGLSLSGCVDETWQQVKKRHWKD